MGADEQAQNDLETVKAFIQLLQTSEGAITFRNDRRYVELSHRPKAQEAFAIAFQAVFREDVQSETLRFVFEAIEGIHFWMQQAKEAQAALDNCTDIRRK